MNGLIAVKHYRHSIKMFRHLTISQFAPCDIAEIMLLKLVRTSGLDLRDNVEICRVTEVVHGGLCICAIKLTAPQIYVGVRRFRTL